MVNYFFLIVFLLATAYPVYTIAWDGLLQEILEYQNAYDNFCNLNGYEKSTGTNEVGRTITLDYVQVECDKEFILNWIPEKRCVQFNKWGECKEEDFIVNIIAKEDSQ